MEGSEMAAIRHIARRAFDEFVHAAVVFAIAWWATQETYLSLAISVAEALLRYAFKDPPIPIRPPPKPVAPPSPDPWLPSRDIPW